MNNKNYKCHNCGNLLDNFIHFYKCPYCGAEYNITSVENLGIKIEQFKEGLDVLQINQIVNNEILNYLNDDRLFENHIKSRICDELAKELYKYIEIDSNKDLNRQQTIYSAKLRIPKKEYKF